MISKKIQYFIFLLIIGSCNTLTIDNEVCYGHFKKGDYHQAIDCYDELLNNKEDLERKHLIFINCYLALRDYEKAKYYINTFLDKDPDHFRANLKLARMLNQKGKKLQSISILKNLRLKYPSNIEAIYRLLEVNKYFLDNELIKEIENIDIASQFINQEVELMYYTINFMKDFYLKIYRLAISFCKKEIDSYKKYNFPEFYYSNIYNQIIECYLYINEIDKALVYIELSLKNDKDVFLNYFKNSKVFNDNIRSNENYLKLLDQ